jgi:hypothetical protein
MPTSSADRHDRIDALIAAQAGSRLLRGDWNSCAAPTRQVGGLLEALGPDITAPELCPPDVMPAWLADFAPYIDGNTSAGAWPLLVERFCRLAQQWHVLDETAWRRCDRATRLAALERAEAGDTSGVVRPMIELMTGWTCDRTGPDLRREVSRARAAARRAERVSRVATCIESVREVEQRAGLAVQLRDLQIEPEAMSVLEPSAADRARDAARRARSAVYAARAAAWAGERTRSVAEVADVAVWASADRIEGMRAAWDAIICACLDAIQTACDRATISDAEAPPRREPGSEA